MRIIKTEELSPEKPLDYLDNLLVYNGLDAALTYEILDRLLPQLIPSTQATYDFERALQGPILEANTRGIRIDEDRRQTLLRQYREETFQVADQLNRIIREGCGFQFEITKNRVNTWPSDQQLCRLFYEYMGIPAIYKLTDEGERRLTVDRKALEKIEGYFYAEPIVRHLYLLREHGKKISFLNTAVDGDGRLRTSFSIAGTTTGRLASSFSEFGTGTNLQNVENRLRAIFIADPGYKFGNIDLEQSDARAVGAIHWNLFRDSRYLDLCECLTKDHEVLTPEGWCAISEKPTQILTWDKGITAFTSVIRWNEYTATELICFDNRNISIKGTNNHQMPVYNGEDKLLTKTPLSKIMLHPNYSAPNTGTFAGGMINEKDAALIAAFQADGTRDTTGRMHWTFLKEHKIKFLRKLLEESGLQFSEYNLSNGTVRFYLRQEQRHNYWPKTCNSSILNWDADSIKSFCASHLHWDASSQDNGWRIVSNNSEHIDWLATAYSLCNYQVSLNKHKGIYWILTIKSRKTTQYRSGEFTKLIDLEEKVYCPTTISGFFIVRRNKKIFISGNSGDLHTGTARIAFPQIPWTKDYIKDRQLADGHFYREFSYRDASKRLAHGSSYQGEPKTMARETHIPIGDIEKFQRNFIPNFAFVPWWEWVDQQIKSSAIITSFTGRRRKFYGHPKDPETLRAAIAYEPQNVTADTIDESLLDVWRGDRVQLLLQVHDSILFQYKEEEEDEIIPWALEQCKRRRVLKGGREFVIPAEAKVGWNWSDRPTKKQIEEEGRTDDPDALMKWPEKEPRRRVRG